MSRIARDSKQTNLPIVGKIKIGEKRKSSSGKMIPASLDYFVATGNYADLFAKVFDKPSSITIIFTNDDDSFSCDEYYECRGKKDGSLYGKGDGKSYSFFDAQRNIYLQKTQEEVRYEMASLKSRGIELVWKASVTIRFLLPDIKGLLGVWELTTHGEKSSIRELVSSFDKVKEMAGTVLGVPFTLSVKKVKSQKPGSSSSFPVVSLVPNISRENVEKIHGLIEAGVSVGRLGILTDDKISDIKTIEYEEVK